MTRDLYEGLLTFHEEFVMYIYGISVRCYPIWLTSSQFEVTKYSAGKTDYETLQSAHCTLACGTRTHAADSKAGRDWGWYCED